MNEPAPICVCVAGWHFQEEVYRALRQIREVDVFLVSHRPLGEVPAPIQALIGTENILVAPNRGYDWGCYEQFRRWGRWKNYSHVIFMHDDIEILSPDFVAACREMLKRHPVVGNSRMSTARNATELAPETYLHSAWKPSSRSFRHDNVRGSFVATTREALDRLGSFEVFWDRWGLTPATGNLSTKASCGKWQHVMGEQCFGFLSETPCASPYIHEYVRGKPDGGDGPPSDSAGWLRRWAINDVYSRFGKLAMAGYWGETGWWKKHFLAAVAKPIVWFFCGKG